jgi:hypothetical protein
MIATILFLAFAVLLAGGVPVATLSGSSVCTPTGTPLLPISAHPRVLAT